MRWRPSASVCLGAALAASWVIACTSAPDAAAPPPPPAAPPEDHGSVFDDWPAEVPPDDGTYDWGLPEWFPRPVVPADNPMSKVKVELGRHLFYDVRLSENRTQSCASCHKQELAFTDGEALPTGSTGMLHPRNSMSVVNAGYVSALTWANPLMLTLEQQALVPMFGFEPVELGMRGKEDELLARLAEDARYQSLFPQAFAGDPQPISVLNVTRALAAFQRTLISYRSPFDRFSRGGDANAISEAAKRGLSLFNSERLECFHCHNGFNMMDSTNYFGKSTPELRFHNTGLYNVGGVGGYPEGNRGVLEITGNPDDMGRFRAQSLRNIEVTAPYMHDGSIATLDDALDHYRVAGRTVSDGPNAGVGSLNPYKSSLLVGFALSAEERQDVLEFLRSLTDRELLQDPRFSDPWPAECAACR